MVQTEQRRFRDMSLPEKAFMVFALCFASFALGGSLIALFTMSWGR